LIEFLAWSLAILAWCLRVLWRCAASGRHLLLPVWDKRGWIQTHHVLWHWWRVRHSCSNAFIAGSRTEPFTGSHLGSSGWQAVGNALLQQRRLIGAIYMAHKLLQIADWLEAQNGDLLW